MALGGRTGSFNAKKSLFGEWKTTLGFMARGILFIVGLFTLDHSLKFLLHPLFQRALIFDEYSGNMAHLAAKSEADIYVFGDSRAQSFYDPDIIQKVTGQTVFNGGLPARYMLYYSMAATLIERHHHAKYYVINISLNEFEHRNIEQRILPDISAFLPYQNELSCYQEVLGKLKEYAVTLPLKEYIGLQFALAKYTHIVAYRYNRSMVPILRQAMGQLPESKNGFIPQLGMLSPSSKALPALALEPELDAYAIEVFVDFIKRSQENGIHIILCIGPAYRQSNDFKLNAIEQRNLLLTRELAQIMNVPMIELFESDYSEFCDPRNYSDVFHLNRKGATIFSQIFAEKFMELLAIRNPEEYRHSPFFPKIRREQYLEQVPFLVESRGHS